MSDTQQTLRETILNYCNRLQEHVDTEHPDADMTGKCMFTDDVAYVILDAFEAYLKAGKLPTNTNGEMSLSEWGEGYNAALTDQLAAYLEGLRG